MDQTRFNDGHRAANGDSRAHAEDDPSTGGESRTIAIPIMKWDDWAPEIPVDQADDDDDDEEQGS